MNLKKISKNKGFTLIEILVVIGIIAVLAAIVLVAINPARQFAQARDAQRTSDVSALSNAIGQKMADCKGIFNASATACPNSPTVCPALPTAKEKIGNAAFVSPATGTNLSCLAPTYISVLPTDPSKTLTAPDTGYEVVVDATTKRVTVSSVGEITTDISITR